MIPVFWLEPTDRVRVSLRRYVLSDNNCDKSGFAYHNADVFIEERLAKFTNGRYLDTQDHPFDDPRWPTLCVCGFQFTEQHEKQVMQDLIYNRVDTGDNYTLRDAPIGAMWDAWWMSVHCRGLDGLHLICRIPGGSGRHDWHVDSRASNCTLPNDNEHKCWVRHGDPRDPQGVTTGQKLHVDKNGKTCSAGAGSIATPGWHGFLHNGHLTES